MQNIYTKTFIRVALITNAINKGIRHYDVNTGHELVTVQDIIHSLDTHGQVLQAMPEED